MNQEGYVLLQVYLSAQCPCAAPPLTPAQSPMGDVTDVHILYVICVFFVE